MQTQQFKCLKHTLDGKRTFFTYYMINKSILIMLVYFTGYYEKWHCIHHRKIVYWEFIVPRGK